jgi:hypothetical protein
MAGATYCLSNTVYSTAGVTQDLTSAGVEIRVGDLDSNLVFYATTTDAANGKSWCNFTIPTATPTLKTPFQTSVQVSITSGAIRVIYPGQKYLTVINPLH